MSEFTPSEREELEKCCIVIERVCRSVGPDCQVIFSRKGVSVAPLSWGGDSTGETFYEALCDALGNVEEEV